MLSLPLPLSRNPKKVHFIRKSQTSEASTKNVTQHEMRQKLVSERRNILKDEVQRAAMKGLQAMIDLYEKQELDIFRMGSILESDNPATKLSMFSAPSNVTDTNVKAAYAALETAKILKRT